MSRPAGMALIAVLALSCLAATPSYRWDLPRGVAPPPTPTDNPMTQAKVELGRRLFYDADLSIDGTLACATCHEQRHAFAEAEAVHPGVRGAAGRRNVMTLVNVGYMTPLTWADTSQTSLEAQVATPVMGEHPVEMGMAGQEAELAHRLSGDACYRTMFAKAFPEMRGQISLASTSKALAAFERTLNSWNAPYDQSQRLSESARHGAALFKADCASCHAGANFTDLKFHAIGATRRDDHGLIEKTGLAADAGAFRTPGLRNVELSAPYLHDGSARTLAAAIFAHDSAVVRLSQDDAVDIEAFLGSLTDRQFLTDARFSLPRSFCGKTR